MKNTEKISTFHVLNGLHIIEYEKVFQQNSSNTRHHAVEM